jgi:hypothetical protein
LNFSNTISPECLSPVNAGRYRRSMPAFIAGQCRPSLPVNAIDRNALI